MDLLLDFFKNDKFLTQNSVSSYRKSGFLFFSLIFLFAMGFDHYLEQKYALNAKLFISFCYAAFGCLCYWLTMLLIKPQTKSKWIFGQELLGLLLMIFFGWLLSSVFLGFILETSLLTIFKMDFGFTLPSLFYVNVLAYVATTIALAYLILWLFDVPLFKLNKKK